MRVCMLLQRTIRHDSRVKREARALVRAGHDVIVVQLEPGAATVERAPEGYDLVTVSRAERIRHVLPLKLYRVVYVASLVRAAIRLRPEVVHAHDIAMLGPGWVVSRVCRAPLVYDTHEFALGVPYRTRPYALLVRVLERLLIGRAAAVVTVSPGIAERLETHYRLPRKPLVLRNLPDLDAMDARAAGDLSDAVGVAGAALVLHQGAPARHRGCENVIRSLLDQPAENHVVFLGDAAPGYVAELEALAGELGVTDRVHFLPSRPSQEMLAWTRTADVGVSLLEDIAENHRLALPNKLFEYIAAGIPPVVSALPEARRAIGELGVGWTVDPSDPRDIARGV